MEVAACAYTYIAIGGSAHSSVELLYLLVLTWDPLTPATIRSLLRSDARVGGRTRRSRPNSDCDHHHHPYPTCSKSRVIVMVHRTTRDILKAMGGPRRNRQHLQRARIKLKPRKDNLREHTSLPLGQGIPLSSRFLHCDLAVFRLPHEIYRLVRWPSKQMIARTTQA